MTAPGPAGVASGEVMDYHQKTNPVPGVFRRKEYVITVAARPAPEAGQQETGQELGLPPLMR